MNKTPRLDQPVTSLYVHVPFCAHKCEYCAFYSHPAQGRMMERYVSALIAELGMAAQTLRPSTIYFGGGTPSLLPEKMWENILNAVRELGLTGASEWTVECNPATVSISKAKLLRSAGVNRVSMGVQSFDSELLERLGRIHTRQMVFDSYEILRNAGFDAVNLDLMFAIPGQTMAQWRSTLEEAIRLHPEHLSSYEVIYEEGTPLYEQMRAGRVDINEDLACEMYQEMVDRVTAAGYFQYEVANFGKLISRSPTLTQQDLESPWLRYECCRHNVNYWRAGSFQGAGPSATSYVNGTRSRNWADTAAYCDLLEKRKLPLQFSEKLSPKARAGEAAAFGLRMIEGWPFELFQRVTGFELRDGWSGEMQELSRRGWGEQDELRFRLTEKGLRFADSVAEMFLR